MMAGIEQATYCENTWKSADRLQGLVLVRRRLPARRLAGEDLALDRRQAFTTVYNDDQKNTLYQSRAIAAGFVAPR